MQRNIFIKKKQNNKIITILFIISETAPIDNMNEKYITKHNLVFALGFSDDID